MTLTWCLVLCGVVTVDASVSIAFLDSGLSVCVKKIVSSITESEIFASDVSLIDGENVVVQNLHGIKGARFITTTQSWANHDIYHNIYVMNFHNFSDMKSGFGVVLENNYWTLISKFIIVMEKLDKNLTNINDYFKFNNIYNVTILSKEADDYTIYSFHSPIRPCNNHQRLVRITQCSLYNGESEIFPIITINDLRGCRFKLAAHNFFPMVNMDDIQSEGYEQKMMKIFSERYNFVIELVESYKIDRFERAVGTYWFRGMLDTVRTGTVDGAVGGYFLDVQSLGKFSFTYPLTINHLVVVMPRAKVLTPWLTVYHKSSSVTILVFSLIVIFTVLAYLLNLFLSRKKDLMRDFMIVFGYFLNKITVDKMKKGVPESLIITLLLLIAFILPYTIQAFLCSVHTHPIRDFEVKTIEEIDENYQKKMPVTWTPDTNESQPCFNLLSCLSTVSNCKDRKHYTTMSDITFETYRWMLDNGRCGTDMYTLREPIYTMMETVYFRSRSVLSKYFDDFIFFYAASGLRIKHLRDLIWRLRLKCRQDVKPDYAPIGLEQVQPAFVILIGGSCLSIICFICELIINKRN